MGVGSGVGLGVGFGVGFGFGVGLGSLLVGVGLGTGVALGSLFLGCAGEKIAWVGGLEVGPELGLTECFELKEVNPFQFEQVMSPQD